MNFIKLHMIHSGQAIHIQCDKIDYISPGREGCTICMGSIVIEVIEKQKEIFSLIERNKQKKENPSAGTEKSL